jgi:diguanylate cyclase (GGDEF)-like protein/PAS domain S-box-containing protein/excisionase family DNA binding protein
LIERRETAYLTTGEAARLMSVSRHTLLRAVHRGEIRPAMKTPGGRLRFRLEDVEALVEALSPIPDIEEIAEELLVKRTPGPYDAYVEAFFQVPTPVALLAQDGTWLLVNPAMCSLLGYTQDELLALGPINLTHPDDRENSMDAQGALVGGKRLTANFQKRYVHSSGRLVWVDVTASLVSDEQGQPLYFVNQLQDITEQKLAEEARRAGEELLRSVVTHAPIALLAIDMLGTITLAEGNALQGLGLDPLDLVGRALPEAFPDKSEMIALARRATTGESVSGVVELGGAVLDSRWTPLYDGQHLIVGAISIGTDISVQKLAERELIEREARFRALTENAGDLICVWGASGTVEYESPSYARLLGRPLAGWAGEGGIEAFHPDDREKVRLALQHMVADRVQQTRLELRHLGADGTWHTLDSVIVNRLDEPAVRGIVATSRDISAQKAIIAALAASENRAQLLIENAPIGACITDCDGNFEIVNAAYADIYGFLPEQLLGQHVKVIKEEVLERQVTSVSRESELAADGIATTVEYEIVNRRHHFRMVSATTFNVLGTDGRPRQVSFLVDVTDQKRHEQQLAYAANHDTLTGLPNRALFADRLEHALHMAARDRSTLAIFQIDLDRFKVINDRYGHEAGDVVLKMVAQRISSVLRVSDTVARLGGDEFAVILPHSDEAGAMQVATKVRSAVNPSIDVMGTTVSVDASIGISLYPEHASDSTTLMRLADQAMYVAKAESGGAIVHSGAKKRGTGPRSLAADQRDAIKCGQMRLWYQPVVDCRLDRTMRVEALVYWQHPTLGLLEAADFVPVAEQVRTIDALTVWILEQILRQIGLWRRIGVQIDVSVNISLDVLLDPHFPDLITALLRQHSVEPGRLIFEIGEASLLRGANSAILAVHRMATLGVRVALDSVGVENTSFELVSRLPLSEIKVDKSIVRQLYASHGPALVGGILGLSRGLGIRIVAEGVEDRGMWERLRSMGFDLMQGRYLCRPLPPDELAAWISASRRVLANPAS